MTDTVSLTIDGQEITVPVGTTILHAAQSIGEEIPTICYHEHCTPNALCRTCVVEVEGARFLVPSCTAQVSPGMTVHTRSERVERSRRTILELLDSAVDLSDSPEILSLLGEYSAERVRFPGAQLRPAPLFDANPMYLRA